jgi:hypothetical protein
MADDQLYEYGFDVQPFRDCFCLSLSSQPLVMEAQNTSDWLDIDSIFAWSFAQCFTACGTFLKTKFRFAFSEWNDPDTLLQRVGSYSFSTDWQIDCVPLKNIVVCLT